MPPTDNSIGILLDKWRTLLPGSLILTRQLTRNTPIIMPGKSKLS